jgi:transcription elongation factor Elf1
MRLATTDMGSETVESNILPQKVECGVCGAQATLQTIFHYFPQSPSAEHPDDQSPPQIVMILKCPVCGPQTQVKAPQLRRRTLAW